ncbi:hypothetical protein EG329_009459 [Mollisiaceae sp. DMI_Dod_QoI]|nr:hypothetical protein EG329_009459 [Helotiales sp. DMI_Dod_QoI]
MRHDAILEKFFSHEAGSRCEDRERVGLQSLDYGSSEIMSTSAGKLGWGGAMTDQKSTRSDDQQWPANLKSASNHICGQYCWRSGWNTMLLSAFSEKKRSAGLRTLAGQRVFDRGKEKLDGANGPGRLDDNDPRPASGRSRGTSRTTDDIGVPPKPPERTKEEVEDMLREESRIKEDLRKAGLNDKQIAVVLEKNLRGELDHHKPQQDRYKPQQDRPTYTRMSRRHLSIETLNRYRIDYELDQLDSEYILIKRWVPEYEQDFLWSHTKEIRERRAQGVELPVLPLAR